MQASPLIGDIAKILAKQNKRFSQKNEKLTMCTKSQMGFTASIILWKRASGTFTKFLVNAYP